jgi:hypothetical protein
MKQYGGDGYKQQLLKMREEGRARQAKRDAKQGGLSSPLAERIRSWWDRLPIEERQQHYRIEALSQQFNTAPRLIGPVLFDLGWKRERVWSSGGPHYRVWIPPETDQSASCNVGVNLRDT